MANGLKLQGQYLSQYTEGHIFNLIYLTYNMH